MIAAILIVLIIVVVVVVVVVGKKAKVKQTTGNDSDDATGPARAHQQRQGLVGSDSIAVNLEEEDDDAGDDDAGDGLKSQKRVSTKRADVAV